MAADCDDDIESGEGILAATVGRSGNVRQVALDLLTGEQVEKAVCLIVLLSDRTGGDGEAKGSRQTYGSKVDLDQGSFLSLIFFEDGVRVFGTADFEHDIPSVVLRKDRGPHLLLDSLAQELQEGKRGRSSDVD